MKGFHTKNGKPTDILHSYSWMKCRYRQREKNAFNKDLYRTLSPYDKYLLRGYATALADKNSAYHYNKNKNKKK